MNWYFVAAAVVIVVVGLVHSLLGEHLVFRRMRLSGVIPVNGGSALLERHVRILWASWHLVTVLGWLVAAILVWLSFPATASLAQSFLTQAIVVALFVCAAIVFIATKGRHPGWVGLVTAAVLTVVGRM
ncbi:MAG: hypothetical protein ABIZ91_11245 [Gemmatimonadaceae bacterium]